MSLVVSDTGPIHYLVLADLVDILPRLFSTVFIPGAVQRELLHRSAPTRLRSWLASAPVWLQVRDAKTTPPDSSTGAGERAAIALALEISADALLADDELKPTGDLTAVAQSVRSRKRNQSRRSHAAGRRRSIFRELAGRNAGAPSSRVRTAARF